MRTIFHLDLDAFFVSVERLLDPFLEGKPVIVGADPQNGYGRGVISACSYEARKFGLHSGMSIRQAYKQCPNGIYLRGHGSEYKNYSRLVENILERFAPQIEQASIDEFYMDFTGTKHLYKNWRLLAIKIQKTIDTELSLPVSIGIATNKTLAKIASDFFKPKGITEVLPGMEKEFLRRLPVEVIPGVGRMTLPQLHSKGFYKVGDITRLSEKYFSTAFGKAGIDLFEKANGKGKEFLSLPHERKSISKEHTFGEDILNFSEIEAKLFLLSGKICQKLRNNNWFASTVTIKLRYSDFVTLTRAKTLKPTDDDKIVYETALEMLRKAYTRRVSIRLIGVGLTNFSWFTEQEELFEDENIARKKMFRAVTRIRDKFGYSSILIGDTAEKANY